MTSNQQMRIMHTVYSDLYIISVNWDGSVALNIIRVGLQLFETTGMQSEWETSLFSYHIVSLVSTQLALGK